MTVQYCPTADTKHAQLFQCCTLPQHISTPP